MDPNKIAEEQWERMNRILRFPGTAEQFSRALKNLARRYPTHCDWCRAEGKMVQTGWSKLQGTTKICERHDAEQKAEICALPERA